METKYAVPWNQNVWQQSTPQAQPGKTPKKRGTDVGMHGEGSTRKHLKDVHLALLDQKLSFEFRKGNQEEGLTVRARLGIIVLAWLWCSRGSNGSSVPSFACNEKCRFLEEHFGSTE